MIFCPALKRPVSKCGVPGRLNMPPAWRIQVMSLRAGILSRIQSTSIMTSPITKGTADQLCRYFETFASGVKAQCPISGISR